MNKSSNFQMKSIQQKGFTLIELMMVVAVVAVLAAIAVPSYQNSVQKAKRADGIAALTKLQLAQEKFRANCAFYATNLGAGNTCGTSSGASTVLFSATSDEGFYNISVTAATGNSYTIQADPTGSQAGDTSCDPMTYTHPTGVKGPAGCWD